MMSLSELDFAFRFLNRAPCRNRARASAAGFTFIELMVVLVLMALFSSMVFISVASGIFRSQEERFVRQFEYGLKRARISAVGQGRQVAFVIDAGRRRIEIDGQGMEDIPESIQIEGKGIIEDQAGRFMILFFPDGSSSGGQIEIKWEDGRTDRLDIGMVWGSVIRRTDHG